jgi:hypothetical protein
VHGAEIRPNLSDGKWTNDIPQVPRAQVFYFLPERSVHGAEIRPNLSDGKWTSDIRQVPQAQVFYFLPEQPLQETMPKINALVSEK